MPPKAERKVDGQRTSGAILVNAETGVGARRAAECRRQWAGPDAILGSASRRRTELQNTWGLLRGQDALAVTGIVRMAWEEPVWASMTSSPGMGPDV